MNLSCHLGFLHDSLGDFISVQRELSQCPANLSDQYESWTEEHFALFKPLVITETSTPVQGVIPELYWDEEESTFILGFTRFKKSILVGAFDTYRDASLYFDIIKSRYECMGRTKETAATTSRASLSASSGSSSSSGTFPSYSHPYRYHFPLPLA